MLFRVLALLTFAFSWPAQAANIVAFPLGGPGEGAIMLDGKINYEDREAFLAKISPFSSGIVILNSEGGNAYAGIEIGRAIRMRGFKTWVPSGKQCASACAFAWLGGAKRLMGKGAQVGFHAVYTVESGMRVETGAGNAMYGAYLAQLGLSDNAIFYLSNAAPSSMNWLTAAEAEKYGIEFSFFDPKDQTASTPPPETPPPMPSWGSIEARSRDFVIAMNVLLSGPSDQYLRLLNGLYSERVIYFGKELQRAEIVTQLTKFIERWPERSYVVKPELLKVQCDNAASACQVTGLVEFSTKSVARNQWSRGTATFDYVLSFSPAGRWPVIVNENGGVVNRQLSGLQAVTPRYRQDFDASSK